MKIRKGKAESVARKVAEKKFDKTITKMYLKFEKDVRNHQSKVRVKYDDVPENIKPFVETNFSASIYRGYNYANPNIFCIEKYNESKSKVIHFGDTIKISLNEKYLYTYSDKNWKYKQDHKFAKQFNEIAKLALEKDRFIAKLTTQIFGFGTWKKLIVAYPDMKIYCEEYMEKKVNTLPAPKLSDDVLRVLNEVKK